MKNLTILYLIFISLTGFAQTQRHSLINLQAGIASPTTRWDKDFDAFDAFFLDITSLSVNAGPRLYSKPAFTGTFSYLHNLESSFTWKTEAYGMFTGINTTFGNSYADSLNIGISDFGLAAYAVKTFKPGTGNYITLQLGASAGLASLKNTELVNTSDTTDFFGLTSIIQTSTMQMELTSDFMVRAIGKVEWFSRLNDHWSVSASFSYLHPLTKNTRFAAETNLETAFLPINTNYATENFSMPFWSVSAGIVRDIYVKKKPAPMPGF
jgi:hypothetical protein